MARINIEDDLETHDPFWKLLPLVGNDRDVALGKCVRFFRLAQKRFVEKRPITEQDLEESGLLLMVEAGWAVPVEGGFQVRNADRHFAWLAQKHEAGKKGGRPRKEKPEETGRLPEETGEEPAQTGGNPPTPTPAPSRSITKGPASGPLERKMADFCRTFVGQWQKKYPGAERPHISGKVQAKLREWIESVEIEHARRLIATYFALEEPWFVTKGHDLSTFLESVTKLEAAGAPASPWVCKDGEVTTYKPNYTPADPSSPSVREIVKQAKRVAGVSGPSP